MPYNWDIELLHDSHLHPVISSNKVLSDVLNISSENHGGDWDLHYRFILTMRTDTGQPITVQRILEPALVDLTFKRSPPVGRVTIDSTDQRTPHIVRSIVGVEHSASVEGHIVHKQGIWLFDRWAVTPATVGQANIEGAADPNLHLLAPPVDTTYTARYEYDRPALTTHLPLMGWNG